MSNEIVKNKEHETAHVRVEDELPALYKNKTPRIWISGDLAKKMNRFIYIKKSITVITGILSIAPAAIFKVLKEAWNLNFSFFYVVLFTVCVVILWKAYYNNSIFFKIARKYSTVKKNISSGVYAGQDESFIELKIKKKKIDMNKIFNGNT